MERKLITTSKARVAVNGYGVIGKRVTDYRIRVAVERGFPVYAPVPDQRAEVE